MIGQTTRVRAEETSRVVAVEPVSDDSQARRAMVRSAACTPGRTPRPRANAYSRPTDKNHVSLKAQTHCVPVSP